MRALLLAAGVVVALAGGAAIRGQASSGAQPWSDELSDNLIFAKSIVLAVGLGVAAGLFRGLAPVARRTARRAGDGAIRRFAPGTVAGHWLLALGVLLALPTGMWQYLGGLLDVSAPIPLYLFYRVHYVGGALILFVVASFLVHWWLTRDRSLLVPRGQWTRHLRGLADELPPYIGALLARLLRLDLRPPLPETGRFTYYETAFSFPTWAVAIALITVSGLVKALRYVYPVPGPVLFWASTLHVAAMVMIALKVLDHLRYTIARWPLVVAMVTSWVSEAYVRARHPAWHREIEQEATPPDVGAAGAPVVPTPAGAIAGSER